MLHQRVVRVPAGELQTEVQDKVLEESWKLLAFESVLKDLLLDVSSLPCPAALSSAPSSQ